jgi:putative YhdH/YhfP family quinone oxidoreductase
MMTNVNFCAMVVSEEPPAHFVRRVQTCALDDLLAGDVLVRVYYSSLNYKDALSASGNRGVTKHYPHIPGIDAAGKVVQSSDPRYQPGDAVIVHGAEFGATAPGGYSEFVRVPAEWLVPLPADMTLRQSMAIGTAGITAALAVTRLREAGVPAQGGSVLVTGATGGVGSIAVMLLAGLGYRVVAATGKASARDWLIGLGAAETVQRAVVIDETPRALLHARWAGVVDTVGGKMLSTALRSTCYDGVVTCCGNVAGADLALTVYPFILRAVRLLGIDVANCSPEVLHKLWYADGFCWPLAQIEAQTRECTLDQLSDQIDQTLQGRQQGRIIVNLCGKEEKMEEPQTLRAAP